MSQIAFKLKIIKETVILVAFDPQLVRCSAFPQKAVKLLSWQLLNILGLCTEKTCSVTFNYPKDASIDVCAG